MKLVWTIESTKRLIEIETFIAEDNPDRAGKFIQILVDKAGLITENPKMCRMVPEFSDPEIRELIVKKYRIVYRTEESAVVILSVFENHRLIRPEEIYPVE